MKLNKFQFLDKSRKLLKVSGKDAKNFLQSIITNDIQDSIKSIIYGGLLTPQGKYLFDFFITGIDDETFIIDIDIERYDDFLDKLSIYRLRSNVSFIHQNGSVVIGFGKSIQDSYYDPRNKELGWRKFIFKSIKNNNPKDAKIFFECYESKRIDLCIPKYRKELKCNETYILEVGFDKINGISFSKGCFVGQEVTARMRHKTNLKNGLVKLGNIPNSFIEDNKIINEKGQLVGSITSSFDKKGLGMIKFIYAKGKIYCGNNELSFM